MMKQILGLSPPRLIMMVGPSGAGKSKIANEMLLGMPVVSTDNLRVSLFGLESDAVGNVKIAAKAYTPQGFKDTFTAAKHIVRGYLLAGQSVVYDATNLSKKDRLGFLSDVDVDFGNSLSTSLKAVVSYYVVDRPLEEKLASFWVTIKHGTPVYHTTDEIITRHHEKMQSTISDVLRGDDCGFDVVDFRK